MTHFEFVDKGAGFPIAWEVGKVERMRWWLRGGTWKTAQPRGTMSHLVKVRRKIRRGWGRRRKEDNDVLVHVRDEEVGIQGFEIQRDMADAVGAVYAGENTEFFARFG